MTLDEIIRQLGGELHGDAEIRITAIAPPALAVAGQIAFFSDPRHAAHLPQTQASALIMSQTLLDKYPTPHCPVIVCNDPYVYYARLAALLNPLKTMQPGAHDKAVVSADVELPACTHVGAGAVIGQGASIGKRCIIHAGAIVGDHVVLGDDVLLYPHSVLYDGVRLGDRTIIHAGAVIGSDGFGFAPNFAETAGQTSGGWIKIPQLGSVIIGDDVEIGANTAIDCGALENTCIGNGVKIDNLVHIAHNCQIGAHTAIAACVGIAGSARIGSYCRVGGAARIRGHLQIADGVTISPSTTVVEDIDTVGTYTGILPSVPHRQWMKNAVHLRRLDELKKELKQLQRELDKN